MLGTILWGTLVLIIVSIFYFLWTLLRDAKHFKDQGVCYLGNGMIRILNSMLHNIPILQNFVNCYKEIKAQNLRFAGSMDFGKPTYVIADLDLAKLVFVKDFDHFVNRRPFGSGHNNVIMSKMLMFQNDDTWKALRSKMSPTFSTGKIRRMFPILDNCGNKMASYLKSESLKSPDGVVDLQVAYSKYTMDVIASVAFGIDSKAFDQTDRSLFEQMGDRVLFKFDGWLPMLKFMVSLLSPKFANLVGLAIMEHEALDFFSGVIKSAIKYRENTQEKRNDFLQLMLEARDGKLKVDDGGDLSQYEKEAVIVTTGSEKAVVNLDDDDIVAQCVLFILGGYDTTQSLLIFTAYNLALYPDLQERLFLEIQKSVEDNDGKLTYDSINQMEYMEMFISETLRYYPPAIHSERLCTKSYKIPDTDVIIREGDSVMIPIYAMQHDPEHYPEPEKFDPERFSTENRAKIHPCAFIPFGYGPRNCIAMRLALVEAKMSVAHLVLNFKIEPSEKTLIPMEFKTAASLRPKNGMPLRLIARN